MQTKVCGKCKIEKPIEEFFKDNSKKDGHCTTCKSCQRKRQKNYSRKKKTKSNDTNFKENIEKDLPDEVWKDIPNYSGKYKASNLGRIKKIKTIGSKVNERILKDSIANHGYRRVNLIKDRKLKTYSIHRLIAITFLPNPNGYEEVNHKDEDKTNNKIENLEWCSHQYNCEYGTRKERCGNFHKKEVYQYDLNMNLIKVWDSLKECEENGYNMRLIWQVCTNKRKTHKKSIWSYEEL